MSSVYTDIYIQNNQFSIVETGQKPQPRGSALASLLRIEAVIRQQLKYSIATNDAYSGLSKENLFSTLREKAEAIRDGYVKKSGFLKGRSALCTKIRILLHSVWLINLIKYFSGFTPKIISGLTRWTWSDRRKGEIETVYQCIENAVKPPRCLDLFDDCIQIVFGFLMVSDLLKVAQVNKHGKRQATQAILTRAKEYGYRGRDNSGAKDYLISLFGGMKMLYKIALDRYSSLEKNCFVFRTHTANISPLPFVEWRSTKGCIDPEASLREMKYLDSATRDTLQKELHSALYFSSSPAEYNNLGTTRALLYCGANPNYGSRSWGIPLINSATYELCEILLEYGADPNSIDPVGITPLMDHAYSPEMTELLCQNGANLDLQDITYNYTALHYSVLYNPDYPNSLGAIEVLLRYGAHPYLQDSKGKMPYEHTTNQDIINLFSLSHEDMRG